MEIGLAVGGAFLSSALNVLFDRLAPQGDLLNMFRNHTDDVQLFEKLGDILLGLQIVLSDAENKKASNQFVSQWLNKLQSAVDGAENLIEQVNYEALRLKVKGQLQNLGETSNQQVSDLNLCLSDDFFLNIKNKLEDTIKKLEVLEKQIGRLGLKEHFVSTKQETRTPSTSLVDDAGIFGRQNDIEDLIGRLLSKDTKGKNLAIVPIVGMGGLGKTTLAKAVYNDERVQKHFGLKAWFCVSQAYDAFRITKGLLQEIGSTDLKVDDNLNQLQVNDLAQIASSNLCIRLEENKGSHMLEQCRHMSYSIGQDGDFEKLKSLFKSEQLRTLLPINIQFHYQYKLSKRVLHNILPRLISLRALSLSGYRIKKLPNDLFIKLKLLRFLDLSQTVIEKLPDSICGLYNLDTLLLSSCIYLMELPLQMEKLINLRHLDISNTEWLKMPLHLSKLKSLKC